MWPGFGENSRVLDWIFRRTEVAKGDESLTIKTPIGYLPTPDGINLSGLQEKVDMDGLYHLPKDFWLKEVEAIRKYFKEQVNEDLPSEIANELNALSNRINDM